MDYVVQNLKIAIVGLGLIGGSILKCLAKKGYYTIAISKSSYLKAKDIANVSSSFDNLEPLKEVDVIFVCSPMSETLAVLDILENVVKKEALVADVCSLKSFVCKKQRPYTFIGTHPMAGSELNGFEHSFAQLFEGAKWVLVKRCEILEKIITDMGAMPIVMDAKTHDRAVATISHLPMLVAQGLFASLKTQEEKILASSGFRDMTRLAMTTPKLADDMLEMNLENIESALEKLLYEISHLKKLPYNERMKVLEKNAHERMAMYDGKGKNTIQ